MPSNLSIWLFFSIIIIGVVSIRNTANQQAFGESNSIVESSGLPSESRPSIDDEQIRSSGASPDDEDGDTVEGSGLPPSAPNVYNNQLSSTTTATTTSTSSTTTTTTALSSSNIDVSNNILNTEIDDNDLDEDDELEDDDDDEDEDEDAEMSLDDQIFSTKDTPTTMRPTDSRLITERPIMTLTTVTTTTTTTTVRPMVKNPTKSPNPSFVSVMNFDMLRPGILAAISGGAVIFILITILLIMFIVYRMRKKDEGSYSLDEPHQPPHYSYAYQKAPSKEFYA